MLAWLHWTTLDQSQLVHGEVSLLGKAEAHAITKQIRGITSLESKKVSEEEEKLSAFLI